MLFWIFVMLIVIGFVCLIIHEVTTIGDWICGIGIIFEISGWIGLVVSIFIKAFNEII